MYGPWVRVPAESQTPNENLLGVFLCHLPTFYIHTIMECLACKDYGEGQRKQKQFEAEREKQQEAVIATATFGGACFW